MEAPSCSGLREAVWIGGSPSPGGINCQPLIEEGAGSYLHPRCRWVAAPAARRCPGARHGRVPPLRPRRRDPSGKRNRNEPRETGERRGAAPGALCFPPGPLPVP